MNTEPLTAEQYECEIERLLMALGKIRRQCEVCAGKTAPDAALRGIGIFADEAIEASSFVKSGKVVSLPSVWGVTNQLEFSEKDFELPSFMSLWGIAREEPVEP